MSSLVLLSLSISFTITDDAGVSDADTDASFHVSNCSDSESSDLDTCEDCSDSEVVSVSGDDDTSGAEDDWNDLWYASSDDIIITIAHQTMIAKQKQTTVTWVVYQRIVRTVHQSLCLHR